MKKIAVLMVCMIVSFPAKGMNGEYDSKQHDKVESEIDKVKKIMTTETVKFMENDRLVDMPTVSSKQHDSRNCCDDFCSCCLITACLFCGCGLPFPR